MFDHWIASRKIRIYIKYEADFGFEFDNRFYPETILFVSEDSLTQINNPEFVFNATQFSEDLQKPIPIAKISNIMADNHFEFEQNFALAA